MPRKSTKKTNPKEKPPPKKRGRKPKPKTNIEKPHPKKRGRKPKGGKIIKKDQNNKVILITLRNLPIYISVYEKLVFDLMQQLQLSHPLL